MLSYNHLGFWYMPNDGITTSKIFGYNTLSITKENDNVDSVDIHGTNDTTLLVPYEDQVVIESAVTKDGYHFKGYSVNGVSPGNEDKTGDFDPSDPDQTITVWGTAELTAQAAANVYHVRFNKNPKSTVSGEMEVQDMVYNEPQKLSANQYTCVGGTFTGWNTMPGGTGQGFDDSAQINETNQDLLFAPGGDDNGKTIDLYAQWNMDTYDITYDLNKGQLPTGKENPQTYTAADSFTLINPERTDYDFVGWTGTGLASPQKKVDIPKDSTGDREYTANWSPKPGNDNPEEVLMAWGTPSGKRAVKTSWTKVDGAAKYLVYAGNCGEKLKLVKKCNVNSFKVKKIKGKKLRKHSPYFFRVTAVDKNGKVIATSKKFHVITAKTMGGYANITKITAKTDAVTLKKGQSATVGAKYTLPKNKKHISKKHSAFLRYTSDNPNVASVDSKGTVTANKAGKAVIYIQDTCGMYCKTVVTVK